MSSAPQQTEAQQAEEAYRAHCRHSYLTFVRGLIIPSQSGPKIFETCMAPFQRECFAKLAPSLHAVRDGTMPPIRRFWWERTKKASKDADLATAIVWLMAFPKRPFLAQVGAADREQAAVIQRRIEALLFYNPWLAGYIQIHKHVIKSVDGLAKTEIVAADIAGSHGETPDFLVVNELSHVSKWEFVQNLLDNADGVVQGVVVIATNAGFKGTPAYVWREAAMAGDDSTYFHNLSKPAPWTSDANLREARKRNPISRYNRLWKGVWASGKGDALDEDLISRVFTLDGPLVDPQLGYRYIAGLDLGVNHDHAGVVILGANPGTYKMHVARLKWWEPRGERNEIDLMGVEEGVQTLCKHFRVEWLGYDPHQAVLMAQRLRLKLRGVVIQDVPFVGKWLDLMANTLKQVLEDGILASYDEDGRLQSDFGKFNIVERKYGLKLDAVSDATGHADIGTALVIALPRAVEILKGRPTMLQSDDVLAYDDDKPLSPLEVDEMHPDLRDIYDSYTQMDKEAAGKGYKKGGGKRKPAKRRNDNADDDYGDG